MFTFPPLIDATFVSRPNRYLIVARRKGRLIEAACRDPGRLDWLLRSGMPLRLRPATTEGRRTAFDVVLARAEGIWVSLVPTLANRLFEDAITGGRVPGLARARILQREHAHGGSRFDFLLQCRGRAVLTEIKSVGLVERGRALFPDAPTARGARHVRELAAYTRTGGSALLAFVVQRDDARAVAPHANLDPDFTEALVDARLAGVRLLGFLSRVDERGAAIIGRLPVSVPR
jgi:sugar fermentation stimulation protein A